VLVVGINFGPEHTGIAPYTTQLCEHLAGRGAEVRVFTGVPHYPSWTVEAEDRFRLRRTDRSPGLEVRRLRHHVPRRQSAARRALYELTFAAQVAAQRPAGRPDVVLAVVPSLLSAAVAARIARRVGAPLVLWVQDLMGRAAAQSGMDGGSAVAGVVGAVEGRLLRRADRVVVLNAHFAAHARAVGVAGERLRVQPNWTHLGPAATADPATVRARLGWRPDETIVLHTGNMGLKQCLENVIDAAGLADRRISVTSGNRVRFVLMGDGSQRAELEARGAGVRALDLRAPAPGAEYADILAAADVLLVNERPTNVDMSLPSKLTSYLHAGRPVVAASPDSGGTAAEVRRSGAGVVVAPGDPAALLDAVDALAAHPAAMAAMGAAGRRYAAAHLSADAARDALAGILHEVADASTAPIPQLRPAERRLRVGELL
jgi:glycosyltransferase involved in cell wall biosynthesis